MADLETLGFGAHGCILQLSAVAFELNGAVLDPHELLQYEDRWFNMRIAKYDGDLTPSAVNFWSEPEQKTALDLIHALPEADIRGALVNFNSFARQWLGKRGFVWAKPVNFDLHILRGAYADCHVEPAWHPSIELDLRTLLWAAKKMPKQNFKVPDMADLGLIKHYALHDAAVQAVVAQSAFCALTISASQRNHPTGESHAPNQKQVEKSSRSKHKDRRGCRQTAQASNRHRAEYGAKGRRKNS